MRLTKQYLLEQVAELQSELLHCKTEMLGRYNGVAQDIDSIKHQVRFMLSRLDLLVTNWKLVPPPDLLEETLNPPKEFIDKIISEARFAQPPAASTPTKPRRKRRAKK